MLPYTAVPHTLCSKLSSLVTVSRACDIMWLFVKFPRLARSAQPLKPWIVRGALRLCEKRSLGLQGRRYRQHLSYSFFCLLLFVLFFSVYTERINPSPARPFILLVPFSSKGCLKKMLKRPEMFILRTQLLLRMYQKLELTQEASIQDPPAVYKLHALCFATHLV